MLQIILVIDVKCVLDPSLAQKQGQIHIISINGT